MGDRGRAPLGTADRQPRARPARVRPLRGRGRQALLGRLRGPAAGRVVLDLERAQPPLLPEAERGRPADLPGDGRRRVAGAARSGGRGREGAGRRDRTGPAPGHGARADATSCGAGCASTSDFEPTPGERRMPRLPRLRRRRLRAPPLRADLRVPGRRGHRQPARDPPARPLPRPRGGGRAAAARRCRSTTPSSGSSATRPIPTASIDLARTGGAPEREGGAVVSLPARCAATRSTCSTTTRRARAPRGRRSGRASRRACGSPTAGASPRGTPTACRSWCSARAAAACWSGAVCGPASGVRRGGARMPRLARVVRRVETNDAGYFEVRLPGPAPTRSSATTRTASGSAAAARPARSPRRRSPTEPH